MLTEERDGKSVVQDFNGPLADIRRPQIGAQSNIDRCGRPAIITPTRPHWKTNYAKRPILAAFAVGVSMSCMGFLTPVSTANRSLFRWSISSVICGASSSIGG